MGSVLIVDDDRLIRLLLRKALLSLGVQVREAETGLRGIEMARAERPGLVLLDYHMPDLDGPAVARAMREDLKLDMPILLLTASQDTEQIEVAIAAGVSGYVSKPIDARLVAGQICGLLNARLK